MGKRIVSSRRQNLARMRKSPFYWLGLALYLLSVLLILGPAVANMVRDPERVEQGLHKSLLHSGYAAAAFAFLFIAIARYGTPEETPEHGADETARGVEASRPPQRAAVNMQINQTSAATANARRTGTGAPCPFCQESILPSQQTCPYCMETLPPGWAGTVQPQSDSRPAGNAGAGGAKQCLIRGTLNQVTAYLISEEFVQQWQNRMSGRMKPSVNFTRRSDGVLLVFGAGRFQKDSRRPRFVLTAAGDSTGMRQVRTNQAFYVFAIIVGLLLFVLPGIAIAIHGASNRRYQDRVARELLRVIGERFA